MIHPNMATTLGFVVTDAPVTARFLRRALREAVDATFNTISVDGDTNRDAAWYYPETKSAASQIEGRVAFWRGVTVTA